MSRRSVQTAFVFALLGAAAATTLAQTELTGVALDPASGIGIKITSVFDALPPHGFAPLLIHINNGSEQSGAWVIQATSGTYRSKYSTRQTLVVEARAERTFELLVALPLPENTTYPVNHLSLEVMGPGVRDSGYIGHTSSAGASGKLATSYTAMSKEMSQLAWGPLQKACESGGYWLFGSSFDVASAPSDWRAYAGVDTMWISDAEWARMTALRKGAVRQWVGQGGRLFLCPQTNSDNLLGEWGAIRDSDDPATARRYGFGSVTLVAWDGKELDVESARSRISKLRLAEQLGAEYHRDWALLARIPPLRINTSLIIGFVICFALVVGPLNLFVFARAGERHRLFWTTPLISSAGSAVLAVVIVLQDGLGGEGHRLTAVHLSPIDNEAAVVQEQVARTGLLFTTRFDGGNDLVVTPLKLQASSTRSSSTIRTRLYSIAGGTLGGDWFSSRALQAHLVQAVRPTRARVELLNADATRDTGVPPVVVSTIPETLSHLLYIDPQGGKWMGQNLRAGERRALVATSSSTLFDLGWSRHEQVAGTRLNHLLRTTVNRQGYFYAAAGPTRDAIATLPSIRWKTQSVVYLGPMSDAATGEPP